MVMLLMSCGLSETRSEGQSRDQRQRQRTEHRALEANGQVHQKRVGTPQVEGACGGMQQDGPLSPTGGHQI